MSARSPLSLVTTVLIASLVGAPHLVGAASQSPASEDSALLFGVWNLDVAKSKYTPGPAPKQQTRTYEAHAKGLKATIRTVDADGHSATVEYVASYDGVEYPVIGAPETETIALKKVDSYTAEATLSHAGKTIGRARRVISKDGKTMTITFEAQSGRVHNVAVYTKASS